MQKIGVIVDNDLHKDERVLREIRLLQKLGFEIYVLCYGFTGETYTDIEGVTIERIKISFKLTKRLFFLYQVSSAYKRLWTKNIAAFIKKFQLEVLHVHDLYMSKPAHLGIKKSKIKIPLVLDLHENYPAAIVSYNWTKGWLRGLISQPQKWKKLEKSYLQYANRLIVLSENYKNELIANYSFLNDKYIGVIPNVLDLKSFEKPKSELPLEIQHLNNSEHVVFFYFGGIAERKGVFKSLNLFRELLIKYPNCRYLLIGPIETVDRGEFDRVSRDLIEDEKLIYIPWIDLKDLLTYMSVSDIGLAPFVKNLQCESGVANKIYQYMYGKLPSIVSSCRPQQVLLEMEEAGFAYNDDRELFELMEKLVQNKSLRKRLGENGYRAIVEKYNIQVFTDEMKNIFSFN